MGWHSPLFRRISPLSHSRSYRAIKISAREATIDFLWATAYDTLHDKKQAVAYYHRFLDSAAGKLPDQEWQARQRLALWRKLRNSR
jgi:hypothetical protein